MGTPMREESSMGYDQRVQLFRTAGEKPLTAENLAELRSELVDRLDKMRRRKKPIVKAWMLVPQGDFYRPFILVEFDNLREDQAIPLLKELGDGLSISPVLRHHLEKVPFAVKFKRDLLWQKTRSRRKRS